MTEQKDYTVVLLRPDYMCGCRDVDYGQNVYVSFTSGVSREAALADAQAEAYGFDQADLDESDRGMGDPDDYALCVMFPGHVTPCMFGWQV